ncbi:Succinoglycan biosynthesis protein exoL [Bradyrhizobium sp. STM 3809]|uniref:Succinoglycan biosynthesis protein exoL n=1 Tax=Bradyrhizobium sp. STM 3809 TaxID=551936 RepID=UPI0002408886|nr:Succinoglycan biosynthesis protein exoL [Bradyrhizobium sp. STM 3809]CCE00259.1 Succinoglycan biosynthesis protein exoL [Bradyrhizobium sp. STM 3809]
MLKAGGANVKLIGFRRTAEPVREVEGCLTIDLGATMDGAFIARIVSVASARLRLAGLADAARGSEVVLARNLEMLYLGAAIRRRHAPRAALVFECLDIHRLLLGRGLPSWLLRSLESDLMREVDQVLTSSPRFVSEYFGPRRFERQIRIVENKLLFPDAEVLARPPRQHLAGPPWRVGWFGMLRCRRSFDILAAIAREADGSIEVNIAGRPSPKEFPDFSALIRRSPGVSFSGPYRSHELPKLYGEVHFSWAVDFFEQGLNSSWLLPNRIYESSFFGAVPIALNGVETARWLTRRGIGVILGGDPETELQGFLRQLTPDQYRGLAAAVDLVPSDEIADTRQSCRQLVASLAEVRHLPREGS